MPRGDKDPRGRMEDEDFEWDDFKAQQNLAAHGLTFEAGRLAFDDPFGVAAEDRREDYGELRYTLVGMVESRLLSVAYIHCGTRIRIISVRLAEPRERRRYHEETW